MSNETEIATSTEVLETPAEVLDTTVEPIAEVPVLPVELRYEYQPTDEQGRHLGGKQVVIYTTLDELASKLAEQNTLLLRKLRAETRKNRLGISDEETFGEDAPRFANPVSFKQKELTPDQKTSLALSLGVSPEDFDNVTDELFEAKMGVKPSELRQTLQDIQEERITAQAMNEVEAFKRSNPDFYMCQENSDAITNWLARYNLAPVLTNFQRAYDTLKAAGIIIENTPVVVTPLTVPTVIEQPLVIETVIEDIIPIPPVELSDDPTPKAPASRVPVSLNRNNTDETGGVIPVSGSDIVYEVMQSGHKRRFTGLAAIEAMPADEYRRRTLSDPNFTKKEAALEKEQEARRKARR